MFILDTMGEISSSGALGLGLGDNINSVEVIQTCLGIPNHLMLGLGRGGCVILHWIKSMTMYRDGALP